MHRSPGTCCRWGSACPAPPGVRLAASPWPSRLRAITRALGKVSELQPGTAAHLALGKMQEALAGPARARATSSRGEGLEQTHISFPNAPDMSRGRQRWCHQPLPWARALAAGWARVDAPQYFRQGSTQGEFGDHGGANSPASTPVFILAWFLWLEACMTVLRVCLSSMQGVRLNGNQLQLLPFP